MYAQHEPMFLLFHEPTIQEHPAEYYRHITLGAVQVNFKNSR